MSLEVWLIAWDKNYPFPHISCLGFIVIEWKLHWENSDGKRKLVVVDIFEINFPFTNLEKGYSDISKIHRPFQKEKQF